MKKIIIIILMLLILASAVAYRMYRIRTEPVVRSMQDLQAERGMPVLVYQVAPEDFQRTVGVSGSIEAMQSVTVSAKVMDRVQEIHVETGDVISQGNLLVTLNPTTSRLLVAQGEASLQRAASNLEKLQAGSRSEEIANAQATMERAQADRNLMEIELDRQQSLYDQDATTLQQVQRAENQFKMSQAQLASATANYELVVAGPRQEDIAIAQSEVQLAQIALDNQRENLQDHFLYAPCNGVVTRRLLEPGDIAEVNKPIFSVLDIREVYMVLELSELYLPLVDVGMSVGVTIDSLGSEVFVGRVAEINPLAKAANRSFTTRIILDNPDYRLLPGMFGRAHIVTAQANDALAVIADAVRTDQDGHYVFIADSGIAQRRDITIGETFDDRVEIVTGLNAGDIVITMGGNALIPGKKINITNLPPQVVAEINTKNQAVN